MRAVLPLLLCLTLAACGNRGEAPAQIVPQGQVVAPNFGDFDPFAFSGRKPQSYAVHGIDVSRFQSAIDWGAARANGVNFAFIKATEGAENTDPMFKDHWRDAGRAGVARGAYHFWYHCAGGEAQARHFIRTVPRGQGALPPVLDLEWTPFSPTCTVRPAGDQVRREAQAFMSLLERHYGTRPVIYTSVDFYNDNELWRLSGHEFWLRSVAGHPSEKYPGRRWTFWQYTSSGQVPGAQGKIDINVFSGSTADWQAWVAARAR